MIRDTARPGRFAEFSRGWTVLVAASLGSGTGVAPLAFYSLGAFIKPLTQEFGWSRAQVATASLALSAGMLTMGTFIGGLADRYGARRVALVSQWVLAAMLCSLTLITKNIWSLYLGYFALGAFAAGTLPITWSRAVTQWFVEGRGLALGLSLIGTGIAGMTLPLYVTTLVDRVGWRGAYVSLAALPILIGMPFALLFFHEPDDARRSPSQAPCHTQSLRDEPGLVLGQAIRTGRFWQMCAAFTIAALVIGGINVNALPLLTDRGIERGTAAAVVGLVGATVSVGRLVSGYFLDRYRGSRVAFVMLGGPACACVLLATAGSQVGLCAAAIIMIGFAAGAEHDVAAYFASRYFGRLHFGAIYGLMYTLYNLGAGLGPPLAGAAFDTLGNYSAALYVGSALFAVAALLVGTLGPYPVKADSGH